MNQTQPITPQELYELAIKYRWRWLAPTIALTVLAVLFALVKPNVWQASQALTVRDEAIGVAERQRTGKFELIEQMTAVQETVMELARSRGVLEAALLELGPASGKPSADWPTADDIDTLRKDVAIAPPAGAEFGKTEVFYLKVKSKDRQRAVALASAICDQLIARFQGLRNDKAEGMIHELANEANLAREGLEAVTVRLTALETRIGSDLAELRILEKNPNGQGDLRQQVTLIETELRAAEQAMRSNTELRHLLVQAVDDHQNLIATPNRLLESQPALRRLKEGLIDSQLRAAQLLGSMSEVHPSVLAAREAQSEVRVHLRNELATAIRGVDVDIRLDTSRVDSLKSQLDDLHQRLVRVAEERADYANLIEEINQKTKVLNESENRLAEVRSSRAASFSSSLLNRIDTPDTGADPIGPGKLVIVAAGMFGGLIFGAGVMFLTVVPSRTKPSRTGTVSAKSITSDYSSLGNRSTGLSLKNALAKVTHRTGMN